MCTVLPAVVTSRCDPIVIGVSVYIPTVAVGNAAKVVCKGVLDDVLIGSSGREDAGKGLSLVIAGPATMDELVMPAEWDDALIYTDTDVEVDVFMLLSTLVKSCMVLTVEKPDVVVGGACRIPLIEFPTTETEPSMTL